MTSTTTRRSRKNATPPILLDRVRQLQKRLRRLRIDALLVNNPRDIRYLTGFVGDDSWALIPASSSRVHVLSDSRFEEQIQIEAPHVISHIRRKGLAEELARVRQEEGFRRIGLQASYITVATRKAIEKKVGARRIKDVDDGLLAQRAIKDKTEIANIRKAGEIQQEAFRRLLKTLKAGQTENEIAARLEYEMRSLGADGPSFPTIVAAGANASLPHAIPGQAKLQRNNILLVDWGARYNGYCSDMTRVIALGKMPAKIREIYQIVLEAQLAGIEAIRPGARLKDVDAAARSVIEKAGYGDNFGHGLGHGLGLNIHELPSLGKLSKGELQPGQVVTVEPGIYLPGIGGVRIEDDVLVTERGRQVLTHLPKDLDSAII